MMRGAGKGMHEYLLELPSEARPAGRMWVGGDGRTRYRAGYCDRYLPKQQPGTRGCACNSTCWGSACECTV